MVLIMSVENRLQPKIYYSVIELDLKYTDFDINYGLLIIPPFVV